MLIWYALVCKLFIKWSCVKHDSDSGIEPSLGLNWQAWVPSQKTQGLNTPPEAAVRLFRRLSVLVSLRSSNSFWVTRQKGARDHRMPWLGLLVFANPWTTSNKSYYQLFVEHRRALLTYNILLWRIRNGCKSFVKVERYCLKLLHNWSITPLYELPGIVVNTLKWNISISPSLLIQISPSPQLLIHTK